MWHGETRFWTGRSNSKSGARCNEGLGDFCDTGYDPPVKLFEISDCVSRPNDVDSSTTGPKICNEVAEECESKITA